jgi:hypothetical protein
MPVAYSCIGTRALTPEQSVICQKLGGWIVKYGGQLHSGNASDWKNKGKVDPLLSADYAFAHGANQVNPRLVHLHQPWKGFNREQIVAGNIIINPPYSQEILDLAADKYDRWNSSSDGVRNLMTRNVSIVADTNRCLAHPNDTEWGGGTGFGMKLCDEHFEIEVVDLRHQSTEQLRELCESIRTECLAN